MTDIQRHRFYTLFLLVVLRHTCESQSMSSSSPPSLSTIVSSSTSQVSVNSTSHGTSMLNHSHTAHFSSSSSSSHKVQITSGAQTPQIPSVTPASPSSAIASSITYTPSKPDNPNDDSEPETKLYIWQLVAIGCGAFILFLFIIIGLLCYKNKVLKKKLKSSRSYSLPIKDNGAWIDSQDIPLWQKRASAVVSEQPTTETPPTLTT